MATTNKMDEAYWKHAKMRHSKILLKLIKKYWISREDYACKLFDKYRIKWWSLLCSIN